MKELYEAVKSVIESGRDYYNEQECKKEDLRLFYDSLKKLRGVNEHVWMLMDNCTAFYLDNPIMPWRLSTFNILQMIDIACSTPLFQYWLTHDVEWE